jgi:hypothetical protein
MSRIKTVIGNTRSVKVVYRYLHIASRKRPYIIFYVLCENESAQNINDDMRNGVFNNILHGIYSTSGSSKPFDFLSPLC